MKLANILLAALVMFCVACSDNKSGNSVNVLYIMPCTPVGVPCEVEETPSTSIQLNDEEYDYVARMTAEFIKGRADEVKQELEFIDSAIKSFKTTAHDEEELQVLIRQRKVKAELYLFLLQKLEETELSNEFVPVNNHAIVPPVHGNASVLPK